MGFDPISLAAGAAALSTGFQVAGSVSGAMGQKKGADAAAYSAQRRVEAGKLRAMQTDTAMRNDLEESLGNIEAVRAAANTNDNSPTLLALKQNIRGKASRAGKQAVDNINSQVEQEKQAVKFYQNYGQRAMIGGLLGAGGAVASAFTGAMKSAGGYK